MLIWIAKTDCVCESPSTSGGGDSAQSANGEIRSQPNSHILQQISLVLLTASFSFAIVMTNCAGETLSYVSIEENSSSILGKFRLKKPVPGGKNTFCNYERASDISLTFINLGSLRSTITWL